MTRTWGDKVGSAKVEEGFFAPQWYNDAKSKGASRETLFMLVREFCQKNLGPEQTPDDATVEMLISTYEMG